MFSVKEKKTGCGNLTDVSAHSFCRKCSCPEVPPAPSVPENARLRADWSRPAAKRRTLAVVVHNILTAVGFFCMLQISCVVATPSMHVASHMLSSGLFAPPVILVPPIFGNPCKFQVHTRAEEIKGQICFSCVLESVHCGMGCRGRNRLLTGLCELMTPFISLFSYTGEDVTTYPTLI